MSDMFVYIIVERHYGNDDTIVATTFNEQKAKDQARNSADLLSHMYSEIYWTPEEVNVTAEGQRYGVTRLMCDERESGIEIQSWSTPLE